MLTGPATGMEKTNPAINPAIDIVIILSVISIFQDRKIIVSKTKYTCQLDVFPFANRHIAELICPNIVDKMLEYKKRVTMIFVTL
jgi:hypothetical protein